MAGMLEYKCPCCDGAIQFDSATQKMKCPYCDTEFEVDTLKGYDEELKDEKPSEMEWTTPGGSWAEGETAGLHTYSCKSCGGEIVGDDTMAASACPFCGNPIVLTGQFAGDLRPDLIIPFKLDKKAAKEKLQEHLKGKTLLPKVFRSQNHIDEIKGVYVPFWLYDSDADAQLRFTATRTRFWSDDDYDYTETSYYSVRRDGVLGFDAVPVDGSSKMADDLMESIEPFTMQDAVPFKTAYLAGYVADKYDVDAQKSIQRANERIRQSTEDAFTQTVTGYDSVKMENSSIQLHGGKAKYALFPVWVLSTSWHGNNCIFAMNGQTGRLVGELPCSKPKLAIASVLFFVIGFILSQILFMGEYAFDPDYLTFDIEGILINVIAPLIIVIIGDVLLVGQLKTANEATHADCYCGELDLTEKHDTFSHTETTVVMKDDKDD